MTHRTHYRSFQRRVFCKGFPSLLQVKRPNQQHQYSEGIIERIGKQQLSITQKNTNNLTVEHKLTLVQSPHTTLGQETRYSTTAPGPTRAIWATDTVSSVKGLQREAREADRPVNSASDT